jgi:fructokinase
LIAVAGEALIDLIVGLTGRVQVRPGGAPFTVARTVARLGQPAVFIGRLSTDRFGRLLRSSLEHDGVQVAIDAPTQAPTTLATAETGLGALTRYRFYLAGTSASAVGTAQAARAVPPGAIALHVGTLGLVMHPIATSLERLVQRQPAEVLVLLDPNCRPAAVSSRRAYVDRIGRVIRRADVVKAAVTDLAYLFPGRSPEDAAAEVAAAGPAVVIVTDGPRPVRIFGAGGGLAVPVPSAPVADTIGAGDTFGGAFLAWWAGHGLSRADLRHPDTVHAAARAAITAARVTCQRVGADPPWADELAGEPGWEWLPATAHAPLRAAGGSAHGSPAS